jgi:thiol-disulfide isomerase/thioredoxin
MKNLLFLLLGTAFFTQECSSQENRTPQINVNDSTCIKIIADDIVDTLSVQTRFCSLFPFRPCNGKAINIVKSGTYYLSYRMTKPELVKFQIGESFQILLIPGDTTVIHVGFKTNGNERPSVYYKTSGNIYEYFHAKKKKFGYYSFADFDDNPVSKFFNKMNITKQAYSEATDVLNTSVEQNMLFLNDHKKNLPNWLVDLEKANITYGAAYISIQLYTRLTPDAQKETSIVKVKFNNPAAHLSSLYYSFLMEYLYYRTPLENNNVNGSIRAINYFSLQSHLVDSLLSGEIKDYFITCRLADLYFVSNSAEDLKLVDSFIASNYPKLNEAKIRFIKYDKAQTTRFLGIKSNLPKGDKAPRFYLKDMNGTPFELSNFKGKYVYLHFWATWCEPCIKEISTLNQLFSKLGDKPIEIINICLDDNPGRWKQIIEEENLKGTNLICKGNWEKSLKNLYFITEVPHFTLVDQNGLIINNKCNGPGDIYSEIIQLLDKK